MPKKKHKELNDQQKKADGLLALEDMSAEDKRAHDRGLFIKLANKYDNELTAQIKKTHEFTGKLDTMKKKGHINPDKIRKDLNANNSRLHKAQSPLQRLIGMMPSLDTRSFQTPKNKLIMSEARTISHPP